MAGAGAIRSEGGSVSSNKENTPAPNGRTNLTHTFDGNQHVPQDLSSEWQAAISNISQMIENYRESLMGRGVPACTWLDRTLAEIEAAMTEQARYDMAAAGNKTPNTNKPQAYQYPADYSSYYDDLAHSFSQYCLKGTNPSYDQGPRWRVNCQRCVVAYEMRHRGKDVTAHPASYGSSHLAMYPFDAWLNPMVIHCNDSGKEDIERAMSLSGDGSRAQVVVYWDSPHGGGHTFIAEQRNGTTVFIDPQTGSEDVGGYFKRVKKGMTRFCRIDNLQPSGYESECCKEETHV